MLLFAFWMIGGVADTATAQDSVEDIFGGLGTATAEGGDAAAQEPGTGAVGGQVFDGESGNPVAGVTVIVIWPPPADGSEPRQEVQVTGPDGGFEFASIPVGTYSLSFIKSGYRASTMTGFQVQEGRLNQADFPLPPLPTATSDQVLELDAFVVEASTVDDIMAALELRLDADELLNVFSAEDFSKFAAGDVAEALKRVAGVNVVEGQFAIIRGLEDRYSSTLYNAAPIPSPDPDRQSVQLDLFPSDVVSNLVVSKTFGPELPSNSSGGSINVVTHDYPDDIEIKLSGGTGFNENARDRFVEFVNGSPVGESAKEDDIIESDVSLSFGGRREFLGREFRLKGLGSWEIDFETKEGFQEDLEPDRFWNGVGTPPRFVRFAQSGGLSTGELQLSAGRFDLTESERAEQVTAYGGAGLDLDAEGNHKLDASVFFTRKEEETVELKENGYLPNFDYAALAASEDFGEIQRNDYLGASTLNAFPGRGGVREVRTEQPDRGALWFTNFAESESFEKERELLVTQLNGEHRIDALDGLKFNWAANYAKTTQEEMSRGIQFFFEPDDDDQTAPTEFPVRVEELGDGIFASTDDILFSSNEVEEEQYFGRLDGEYEAAPLELLTLKFSTGGWYEKAERDVESDFLEDAVVGGCFANPGCTGNPSQFSVFGDTPEELGERAFELLDRTNGEFTGLRKTSNESEREIWAWNAGVKATFWDRVDVLGGVRLENIEIESRNDPFTGEGSPFGGPRIFPTRYLFFDRLDNPTIVPGVNREVAATPPPGTTFNDQILNIDVPVDPATGIVDLRTRDEIESVVNGRIDERKTLPSVGLAYRPLEGLNLRAAYSQTVARPSFRELGYYVTVEPGKDELIVGNPQLGLSDVESVDARIEYTWGDLGDLVALSAFYKTIQDPIEGIVVRDPVNAEISSSALFRTFFNNPNEAELWGIEVEARKSLNFFGIDFLDYLSIGGNYTYIDAEVGRTDAELSRSLAFEGVLPGDEERFSGLEKKRRLFGQPEWIANADVSFDHPDWGTKATIAFFAISDVLDAAGSATLNNNNEVIALTLDQYIGSFHQLDLVLSQDIPMPRDLGTWTLKFSAKNLTDSTRKIIYDPDQTRKEEAERSFKKGRDYSFSLGYSISF
ncbi:MAG: TonB-dependent receptor [Proteobacteria bacterium]|nr:TonB-dependent receptor [Pseudomonadota bacterium]